MIDSVIYYGVGTKGGTLSTIVADASGSALKKFAFSYLNDQGATVDTLNSALVTRCNIVTQMPVYDASGGITTPRAVLAGFAALVATDDQALADLLWALPNNLCRVQLNRENASVIRTKVPLATLRTLQIDPVFLGSTYNFATIA